MEFWRQHPASRNPLVSQVPLQRLPDDNRSSLAPCKILDLPNSFCRVRQSSWSDSRLFLRRMYQRSLFLSAVSRAAQERLELVDSSAPGYGLYGGREQHFPFMFMNAFPPESRHGEIPRIFTNAKNMQHCKLIFAFSFPPGSVVPYLRH